MARGGVDLNHKDFWIIKGVPVYAVRLEEAALALGITKGALEKRLEKRPELAHKGADGLLRMRVRTINEILGMGDGLEWLPPNEGTPKPPAERRPENVIAFRGKK